jgi:glycyl-tRNA synthetase beta chain
MAGLGPAIHQKLGYSAAAPSWMPGPSPGMDELGIGRVVPVVMAKPANNRGELLLELLSEEIPARMQRRAIDEFIGLVRDKMTAAEIPAAGLRGYVTPRRLTIIAEGIPERQPDRSEERRGPRVGAPQQALDGFLRSAGLSSVEQCEIRDTGRGEFYFAVVQHAGRPAAEVLPELLQAAIAELSWPKSMRFPAARLRWVRPLVSVLCLLDGEVLPISLDEVPIGRTTRGHRFLSPGEIVVDNAADYLEKLAAAYVVLDQDHRREKIGADLKERAAAGGLTVKPDPGLLDEVTGLVEFPVVLIGTIDDASMELPPEVLATAMRTHQKYFSCLRADGSLAPRFLFVANNLTADDGKTIVAGNERVLKARLADARFFWDQDRKIRLEDRVAALKGRVYHAKLGGIASVFDKVQRITEIARRLTMPVDPSTPSVARNALRAAYLAKADLSTGMVGEFPELQGVMGRYYALNDHEEVDVANAIADHYRPLGPNDTSPTAPVSIVVALADKIDTLVAFFAIGEKPSGSGDPFALRRAAQGIIRIILENNLRISLRHFLLGAAIEVVNRLEEAAPDEREIVEQLIRFVVDRLKVHLRDRGVRHDLISAVFAVDEDDLVRLLARVSALQKFLDMEDGSNLLIAYRRASNIVAIEERKGGWSPGAVDSELLREAGEFALAANLDLSRRDAQRSLDRGEFDAAMGHLATLRRPVDEFFEKVTVNVDDAALRENRLRLLSRIRAVMNQVADFSQIEG